MSQRRANRKSPNTVETAPVGNANWGTTDDVGAIAFGNQHESLQPKPDHLAAIEHDRHKSGVNRHVPGHQSHRSRSR